MFNYEAAKGFLCALIMKNRPIMIKGILNHCPVEKRPNSFSKPPWLSFTNSTIKRTTNKSTKNNPNKYPDLSLALVFQYKKNKIANTNT